MAVWLLCVSFFALSASLVSGRSVRTHDFLGVPVTNYDATDIIPNRYIVVYNKTFSDDIIEAHQSKVITTVRKRNLGKRGFTGHLLSTDVQTFKMSGWRAMALEADDKMILEVMDADEVSYVEADTKVKLSATVAQANATLGLIRLSHATANSGTSYVFDNSGGRGITAYVVDTGILTTHVEFQGRASFGANFVNDVVGCSQQRGARRGIERDLQQ